MKSYIVAAKRLRPPPGVRPSPWDKVLKENWYRIIALEAVREAEDAGVEMECWDSAAVSELAAAIAPDTDVEDAWR